MADQPKAADTQPEKKGEPEVSAPAEVPPKRLPWLWTILLLLTLPAVAVGLWYGGTRHRVEDHPKKVKQRSRRLPAMQRPAPPMRPMVRPVAPKGGMK